MFADSNGAALSLACHPHRHLPLQTSARRHLGLYCHQALQLREHARPHRRQQTGRPRPAMSSCCHLMGSQSKVGHTSIRVSILLAEELPVHSEEQQGCRPQHEHGLQFNAHMLHRMVLLSWRTSARRGSALRHWRHRVADADLLEAVQQRSRWLRCHPCRLLPSRCLLRRWSCAGTAATNDSRKFVHHASQSVTISR